MKLLIVDDEELTRTGVVSSIDWLSLGIDEVLQADDGINGLDTALQYRPEIILCDVRMPRMDGITMLGKLEAELPDTVTIFMSGYSDKEYLKAAIRLKAITYIEKPLSPSEICEAIRDARELYLKRIRSHRGETLHNMATASRLALQLSVPYGSNSEAIRQLASEAGLTHLSSSCFTAVITKLDTGSELSGPALEEIYQSLKQFLQKYYMNCIYVEKHVQYLIYFVFGPARPSEHDLKEIGTFLGRLYAPHGKHVIAAGHTVTGVSCAFESYTSAVILLQNSFFFPAGTFLTPEILKQSSRIPAQNSLPDSPRTAFMEVLAGKNREACMDFLGQLFSYYDRNPSCLPNQVKDLYYKLFLALETVRTQQQIFSSALPEQNGIVDALENRFTFQELHQALVEKTEQFLDDATHAVPENSTIYKIKDYIGRNYMNETLSVKDISSHVYLSASYVCTFFKNETGQTLNQYLTEFRMEKAKVLLGDPRYKISEISSKVGYSDGNYFGKSFKKYTGVSPSEFREKIT